MSVYVSVDETELREFIARLDFALGKMGEVKPEVERADRAIMTILRRLPGLREAEMIVRRMEAAGTAVGIIPTAAAMMLLVGTIYQLLLRLQKMEEDIIRSRGEYEDLLREGLDLTHEEYLAISEAQRGYATDWDEFVSKAQDNIFKAVWEAIVIRIERFMYIPPGIELPPVDWNMGNTDVQ